MLDLFTEEVTDARLDDVIKQIKESNNKTDCSIFIEPHVYDASLIKDELFNQLPDIEFNVGDRDMLHISIGMRDTSYKYYMSFDMYDSVCKVSKYKSDQGVTVYRMELSNPDKVKGVSL